MSTVEVRIADIAELATSVAAVLFALAAVIKAAVEFLSTKKK